MTIKKNSHRKASQEVEIDQLLAEEFECDPGFAERFANACGLRFTTLEVESAVPEPSLGGDGYGDPLPFSLRTKSLLAPPHGRRSAKRPMQSACTTKGMNV